MARFRLLHHPHRRPRVGGFSWDEMPGCGRFTGWIACHVDGSGLYSRVENALSISCVRARGRAAPAHGIDGCDGRSALAPRGSRPARPDRVGRARVVRQRRRVRRAPRHRLAPPRNAPPIARGQRSRGRPTGRPDRWRRRGIVRHVRATAPADLHAAGFGAGSRPGGMRDRRGPRRLADGRVGFASSDLPAGSRAARESRGLIRAGMPSRRSRSMPARLARRGNTTSCTSSIAQRWAFRSSSCWW